MNNNNTKTENTNHLGMQRCTDKDKMKEIDTALIEMIVRGDHSFSIVEESGFVRFTSALNKDKMKEIDTALSEMIVRGDHSFSMVEESGFVRFTSALNPRYQIKEKSFYENMVVSDMYPKMQTRLKQELDKLESVTLTTSIWWKSDEQGLLSVTGHSISSDFQLKRFFLKCQALCDRNWDYNDSITEMISSAILEYQLPKEKVYCFNGDELEFLQEKAAQCNVNLLKECVKYAIDSNDNLKQLDKKCKEIAKIFENSEKCKALESIHEKHLKREPSSFCDDDDDFILWNDIFQVKARMLIFKDAITIYAKENNTITLQPDEWMDIELCNRVFQPIEEVIKIWSKASSTAASVIPLITGLRHSLSSDVNTYCLSVTTFLFAQKLLEALESKLVPVTKYINYQIATYLDPRYKLAFFTQEEAAKVTDEVLAQLSTIPFQQCEPPTEVKSELKIDSVVDNLLKLDSTHELKKLLHLYNSEPRIERHNDPIDWWKHNPQYTKLFPIVKRYLSLPPTNDASERLFSISNHLINDVLYDELDPGNGAKALFVKANFKTLNAK